MNIPSTTQAGTASSCKTRSIDSRSGAGRAIPARLWPMLGLAAFLLCGGLPARATTFIYATFTDDTGPGMKLKIYTSTDAVNYTLLQNTGFPSGYLRDPSIMKWTDGKYYVAYTNPQTASCCGPENHFSIASSPDLKTWTAVTTVPAGVTGAVHVWAPEWYIEGGVARVIANIDTLNNDSDFKPYIYTAQNSALTLWSGPTDMNIGKNHIDTFMVKSGSTYHVFTKDETPRYIVHATSSSMTGPWTWVGTGNWAGWGSGLEGPTIVQLDNGTWRMYLDPQSAAGYRYADSSNLNTWSALVTLPGAGSAFRHGTAIRDTALPPPPAGSTYEAEYAPIAGTGAVYESIHAGYSGTGYVNLGATGCTVTFNNVNGNGGGTKSLGIRYALGATAARTVNLVVNGTTTTITFAPTGAWTTWVTMYVNITLNNNSTNTIQFATTGSDSGNIDEITVP